MCRLSPPTSTAKGHRWPHSREPGPSAKHLRRAADSFPERIAIVGTGGISHWPATPDSGKINEPWDRDFLDRWCRNDKDALLDYDDASVYADAGQGASRSARSLR